MAQLIDYYQIQEDLQGIIEAGPAGGYTTDPAHVFIEAMDRETTFEAMPFVNIRLLDAELELRSIPNGYFAFINLEIDIVTFDLSEFKIAAILRDDIMSEVQKAVQENANFSAELLTSTIGPKVTFGAGTPEGAGGHIAVGTFAVVAEAYIDAT